MVILRHYKQRIVSNDYAQTEKDIIVIAYGDHITDDKEMPLVTLNKFLSKFCQNKINSVHILPFYPYSSYSFFVLG